MVASTKILPLQIFLVFCCMYPVALAIDAFTVTIHIKIDLPPESGIAMTDCIGEAWKLKPGEDFRITRWPDRRYVCNVVNGSNKGSWLAFDPQRDVLRTDVYSSVRVDGFYFSYDQSNWLKLGGWQG